MTTTPQTFARAVAVVAVAGIAIGIIVLGGALAAWIAREWAEGLLILTER